MGQVIRENQLAELRGELRARGERIVLTNGHFDLLHAGHLDYLREARKQGDVLFVAVNDDAVTSARKGPRRPILPEDERVQLVAGLDCVDYAFIFHNETAHEVIEMLRPDVYVKGGDYSLTPDQGGTPLPEADAVRACGGDVILIPITHPQSTSAIEQRIIDLWREHGRDDH